MNQQQNQDPRYDIERVLVDQKNKILQWINEGDAPAAMAALEIVADLWRVADYGYKIHEVIERIRAEFPCSAYSVRAALLRSCLNYIERETQ